MDARAAQLAEQFARANEELIVLAERCTAEQWRAICAAEGWSVGVTLNHLAADYPDVLELIQAIAEGRPVRAWTREALEERNQHQAQQFARCTRAETIALLRQNGAAVTEAVRHLSAEQLTRTGYVLGNEVSPADLVNWFLLAHRDRHLMSVRAVLAAGEPVAPDSAEGEPAR